MQTSYEFFKNGGAKEMPFSSLPKDYKWITGCGGKDGWYYNFFGKDEDFVYGKGIPPSKIIMCKIKRC
jgi:hypothetical protein